MKFIKTRHYTGETGETNGEGQTSTTVEKKNYTLNEHWNILLGISIATNYSGSKSHINEQITTTPLPKKNSTSSSQLNDDEFTVVAEVGGKKNQQGRINYTVEQQI